MFQSLAIKYRPQVFSELVGQDAIAQTLSLALDTQRLGHAYLFSGLRGSGKTSSARIFAKSLNCEQGPTSTPCQICSNCKAAMSGRHLDIIEMDAASSRKIDDIRDIIEQTKYAPAMGKFKIFIIDEVHMLTRESYNALLKTLEEPPLYVKFILATTDVLKIPATILSRSQHFRFKKIPVKIIVNHLINILNQEQILYESEALEMIARSGGGSLRDTLTLLDQAIIYSKGKVDPISVAQMLGILDPQLLERFFSALLKQDRDEIFHIAEELESYECEMVLEEIGGSLKEQLKDSQFPLAMIDRFFKIIAESKYLLSLNAQSSFVLILTFLKMLEALNIKKIDERIQELENQIFYNHQPPQPIAPKLLQQTFHDSHQQESFSLLVQNIYKRSYDLGACFDKHVKFVSFENNVLSWSSDADDICKKRLRDGYHIIRVFVEEIYGQGTTIKQVKEQKTTPEIKVPQPEQPPTMPLQPQQQEEQKPPQQLQASPTELPTKQQLMEKIPLMNHIEKTLGISRIIIKDD